MNIFWFDENTAKCPQHYPDKYTYNAIRELGQILQTALVINSETTVDEIPDEGTTHEHHPVVVWASESQSNWSKARLLTISIHEEYKFRYGMNKSHRSFEKLKSIPDDVIERLPNREPTTPPQCFPDEYKRDNYIEGYRNYFANVKYPKDWCTWNKGRDEPEWINNYI